jgi:hypothetical protein
VYSKKKKNCGCFDGSRTSQSLRLRHKVTQQPQHLMTSELQDRYSIEWVSLYSSLRSSKKNNWAVLHRQISPFWYILTIIPLLSSFNCMNLVTKFMHNLSNTVKVVIFTLQIPTLPVSKDLHFLEKGAKSFGFCIPRVLHRFYLSLFSSSYKSVLDIGLMCVLYGTHCK